MKKIFDVLNVIKQKLFVKKDKIHSEKYYRRIDFLNKYSLLFHAIIAMAIVFIVEIISRRSFISACKFVDAHTLAFMYNSFLVFVSFSLVYLFRRRAFARVIITGFWTILGIINGCVLSNRVTPFGYTDLKCIPELLAMNNTSYFTAQQATIVVVGLGAFALFLVALFIKGPKYTGKIRYAGVSVAFLALLFVAIPVTTNEAQNTNVVASYYSNIAQGYDDYGFVYSFSSTVVDRGMKKPEDYNKQNVEDVEQKVNSQKQTTTVDGKTGPNIICVLLESFCDPDEINFLQVNEDPIPTFHELEKDYSSGYLNVPVVGAGTANTEFEMLTGLSMQYFGTGEYPYKTILKQTDCESIASDLSKIGYATHVVHNNGGNFYSRAKVFNNIGFDSFTSKEFMNILQTTENGWSKDDILLTHIKDALDSTEQEDFVFTVSVQGHGNYPTEKVIENPKITVTGAPTEEKNNAWEYYVNQVYEMDQFAGNLVKMMEERGEPTVVVFYGDHLPTMGLEAKDMKNRYLYNTNYVIWDNLGLQKEDRNIPSYQIMADVMDRLGLHSGTVFNYHQQRRQTKDYLKDLELLQYDILYGDQYVYNGKPPITEGHMQMGIKEVTLTDLVENLDETYSLYGTNFTKWSKVYINDEKQESTFLNNTRIELPDSKLKDGDIITVSQVGSSNTIFRTSREYIYMDGKILEYTDEVKEQKNSAKTDGDQQKTENAGQSGEQQDQNNKEEKSGQQ